MEHGERKNKAGVGKRETDRRQDEGILSILFFSIFTSSISSFTHAQ
jgi:hypothetical protein